MAGIENKIHNSKETQEQSGDILSLLDRSIKDSDFKEKIKKDIQTLPEKRQKRYLEIYQKIEAHILSQGKSGKDLFINYLLENPKNRDEIVKFIYKELKKGSLAKIEAYTQKNGYIINDDTKLAFKDFVNGKTEIKEEKTEIKEEKTDKQKEYKRTEEEDKRTEEENKRTEKQAEIIKQQYKNLLTKEQIENNFSGDLQSDLKLLLEATANPKEIIKASERIVDTLKKPEAKPERTKLFTVLQKSSPEKFTSFTNYLKEQDPSFEGFVNQFKFEHSELFSLGISKSLSEALYPEFETRDEDNKIDLGDGIQAQIDETRFPPHRELSNGKYSLDSEIGVGDFYESTVEFEEQKAEFEKTKVEFTQKLTSFQNKGKEIYGDLQQIQNQLQNPELPEDMRKELEQDFEIKKIELQKVKIHIENLKSDYKQEIEKFKQIQKAYEKNLEQDILRFKQNLREKDEKQKQTLKFLSQIGFDLIPQEITDQIIEKINLSTGLKSKYGFTNNIDLANGNLGINKDFDINTISFSEKKAFTEFVNLMISGDREIPNYMMANGDVIFYKTKSDKELGKISELTDKQSYINNKLGINPIGTINTNLEQTPKN